MTKPKREIEAQELVDQLQRARIRLAQTEVEFLAAKEHARAAKRRKKEAKEASRRAKKKSKKAKSELSDARDAVAGAEAKLAAAERSATSPPSKARKPIRDRAVEVKRAKSIGEALQREVKAIVEFGSHKAVREAEPQESAGPAIEDSGSKPGVGPNPERPSQG